MKIIFSLAVFGIAILTGAADFGKQLSGVGPYTGYMLIPQTAPADAPKIDGIIHEKEWSKAGKLSGFCFYPVDRGLADDVKGDVWFSTDNVNLYIGVRTSTPNMDPGGGLAAYATERDGAVYNDDSVEVTLQNPAHPDTVYHLIVNSRGTIFDRKFSCKTLHKDVSFNFQNVTVGTLVQSGFWDLEIAIPLAELGGATQSMRLNVARNWNGRGSSALIPTEDHLDVGRMINLRWRAGAPVPRQEMEKSPSQGEWQVKLELDHLAPGRHYTGAARLIEKSYPQINGKVSPTEKNVTETSQGFPDSKPLTLQYRTSNRLLHLLQLIIFDEASGEVVFQRAFFGKGIPVSSGMIPVTLQFDLPETGSGQVRHYPGYERAVIEFRGNNTMNGMSWSVTGPDDFRSEVAATKEGQLFKSLCTLGKKAGKYTFTPIVTVNGKKQEFPACFTLTQKYFPWQNNSYGKKPVIVAPFVPVKAEGRTLSVLLSKAQIGSSGLFDSLKAKGTELLAKPMHYMLSVDGKAFPLNGKCGAFSIRDNGASVAGSAECNGGGVTLQSSAEMEYDGFFWNKLKINNQSGKIIDKLTLVIPLKNQQAELFHAVADGIRSNPTGSLPSGQGVIWTGDKLQRMVNFGKLNFHPQFVPYIWLGGVEKGISFFMNSSYGTRLAENRPAMWIRRDGEILSLEVDFINLPDSRQTIELEFGLMATPVKPINPELRKFYVNEQGRQIPGMKTVFWLDCQLAGFVENWSKFPHAGDYRLCDAAVKMITTGQYHQAYRDELARWQKDYEPVYQTRFSPLRGADPKMNHYEHWKMVRANYESVMMKNTSAPMLVSFYSDPRLVTNIDDTAMYFKSEWTREPLGYITGYRAMLTPSYLDYLAASYWEQLLHGIEGIYLDDMFLIPNVNPDTAAKRDEMGFVHADSGLLSMRELVKRIAVMQHEMKLTPRYLEVHMTNALLMPCFSLATVQLGWEAQYGEKFYEERFPADYIRAINTGNHIGALPLVLPGSYRSTMSSEKWQAERFPLLSRSQLSMTLPHWLYLWCWIERPGAGIDYALQEKICTIMAQFGCHLADCRFVPYYAADRVITADNKKLLLSSWHLPGKLLVVVSNPNSEANTATLDIAGVISCIDAETGLPADWEKLQIQAHDFKMLQFTVTPN